MLDTAFYIIIYKTRTQKAAKNFTEQSHKLLVKT